MRVEIIRGTDLERKRWKFQLFCDYSGVRVFYDSYHKESRPTKRYKNWTVVTFWERLGSRTSDKTPPAIPPDVEQEAKYLIIEKIRETPITQ